MAQGVSLARAGVTVMSDLDLEFDAERVALVGDWAPLFDFLRGRAELSRGKLELFGMDGRAAVAAGKVGVASARVEYNPSWTAAGYLEKVAWLDGLGRRESRAQAAQALGTLGLGRFASRTLGGLTRVEWLAVALAKASLSAPALVFAEGAFDGLGSTDSDWLEQVFSALAQRCRLVTSYSDLSRANRHLVLRHDHVVLLFGGRVVTRGDPKVALEPGTFLVTVTRGALRLRDRLVAAGCVVRGDAALEDDRVTQLLVSSQADDLSDCIVALAVEHDVPVIELLPVGAEADATSEQGA